MRILIYGGCHAQVLQGILKRTLFPRATIDTVINFELIAQEVPFPFERLKNYDVFLCSPVVNKGPWNTDLITNEAESAGLQVISYPWLQWHGYFPTIKKMQLAGLTIWFYECLESLALEQSRVADFVSEALEGDFLRGVIKTNLYESTDRLSAHEKDNKTDVVVSDFILQNYSNRRLFMTPDHPALCLYQEVSRQIGTLLGKFTWPLIDRSEPQNDDWTPILPRVHKGLSLKFTANKLRLAGAEPENLSDFLPRFHTLIRGDLKKIVA